MGLPQFSSRKRKHCSQRAGLKRQCEKKSAFVFIPPQLAYPTYWLYLSSDELYSSWLFLMDSSPPFRNSQTKTFHMTDLKTFDWGLSRFPWTCLHNPFLWNRASLDSGPPPLELLPFDLPLIHLEPQPRSSTPYVEALFHFGDCEKNY